MDPFALNAILPGTRPLSPEEYLRALHPESGRGKLTLMAKLPTKTASRCMRPDEAPGVIDAWVESQSYVSMHRFHGPRRVERLAELNALYVDLDVYRKPYLDDLPRQEILRLVRLHLAAIDLPDPSFVIDSGRGLYIIYLIDPCPVRALPRWQEVEKCLVSLLESFGSDAACADAARVLRVPGTTNPKTGGVVSIIDGDGQRHGFDGIADAIFRASRRPTRKELRERKSASATERRNTRGLHPHARFEAVLRDLERIRLAWGGSIPEGIRNVWLHLAVTSLTFTSPPDEILPEALRLAALATPGLSSSEVRATARSAISRAEAVTGGYLGPGRDPRLNYSGERMIEVLGVSRTMAEAIGLEQIIPQDLRTDRRNARRRERRYENGGLSREAYLAQNTISKDKPWAGQGVARSTYYARKKADQP